MAKSKILWADPLGPNASPRDEIYLRHAAAPHVGIHVMRLDDGYFYACDGRQALSDGSLATEGPFKSMAAAERAAQRVFGG